MWEYYVVHCMRSYVTTAYDSNDSDDDRPYAHAHAHAPCMQDSVTLCVQWNRWWVNIVTKQFWRRRRSYVRRRHGGEYVQYCKEPEYCPNASLYQSLVPNEVRNQACQDRAVKEVSLKIYRHSTQNLSHLARIEQVEWVEGAFDSFHEFNRSFTEFFVQIFAFTHPYAMLAGA